MYDIRGLIVGGRSKKSELDGGQTVKKEGDCLRSRGWSPVRLMRRLVLFQYVELEMVKSGEKEDKMSEERVREEEMRHRLEEIAKVEEFVVAGETTIEDDVIASIAGVAAKEVEGVASLGKSSIRRTLAERIAGAPERARGVEVEVGKKEAIVDLTLNVIYGFNIPKIIIDVRKRVAARLLDLAGLIAKEINVDVTGIEFPERMPGKLE